MMLVDANVLIYAFRRDSQQHADFRAWLEEAITREPVFGYSEFVLASVVRITTHPRIFAQPSTLSEALTFATFIRTRPRAVAVHPGRGHWDIFAYLCQQVNARGNLTADAYLAALALESGSEWITTDHDFARFPGLRWRHPLAASV